MIRVMVVEDEPPIAQSIKRLVEEYDDNVTVVYIAINGQRALEYLRNNPVDVIFSDIKMPVMDGIELARCLSIEYPHVIMVIISGFQEFEFARSAIRYGVNNYLLKPVSREHIAEALNTVCTAVREERNKCTRTRLERAVNSESAIGFPEDHRQCGVALVYGGAYPLIPDQGMLEIPELWSPEEIEGFVAGQLEPEATCICVTGKNLWERAVVFSADRQEEILSVAQMLYDYLLTGNGEVTVTVAVWEQPAALAQIGDIFARLRKQIYKEIRLFRSQLIVGEPVDGQAGLDAGAQQNALVLALQTKDRQSIEKRVRELVHVAQSARQAEFLLCIEKLLLNFFDSALTMSQIGELKFEVESVLSTSLHPADLVEELSQVLYAWVGADSEMARDQQQQLCDEVAGYLRVHYRENISNAALARQFGFSSTQLAKKFRECFGVSISEYVNDFRIKSAQAMMRSDKKLMIKEVALDVGYNDQYYFSKIFKKITGIWPTEYQRDEKLSIQ